MCVKLSYRDTVVVDEDCLSELYQRLGRREGDLAVVAAMETLTRAISELEQDRVPPDDTAIVESARELADIAPTVGLPELGVVAASVCRMAELDDRIAFSAVSARLVRLGAMSLAEFWRSEALLS